MTPLLFAFILTGSIASAWLSYRWLRDPTRQECVGGCGRPAVVMIEGYAVCANFAVELMLEVPGA